MASDKEWESKLETIMKVVLHATSTLPAQYKIRVRSLTIEWCTEHLPRPGHPHDPNTILKIYDALHSKKQD